MEKEDIVWLPEHRLVRVMVIAEEHEPAYAGHFGREETVRRVAARWWWPRLRSDVEEFVRRCDRCQRNKPREQDKGQAPMQTVEAGRPGQVLTLDFLCGLYAAADTKHTACLVVTDRFTKMVWLLGCDDHLPAKATAELLLQHVIARQGLPSLIISDRGPQFESSLWIGLWERLNSRVALAAAQHPQTDGATERANQTVLKIMRKTVVAKAGASGRRICPCSRWRSTPPGTPPASRSPSRSCWDGYRSCQPRCCMRPSWGKRCRAQKQADYISSLEQRLQEIWRAVREAAEAAQEKRMREDPQEGDRELRVGDEVLVDWSRLQGMEGVVKLRDKWGGPYFVTRWL